MFEDRLNFNKHWLLSVDSEAIHALYNTGGKDHVAKEKSLECSRHMETDVWTNDSSDKDTNYKNTFVYQEIDHKQLFSEEIHKEVL